MSLYGAKGVKKPSISLTQPRQKSEICCAAQVWTPLCIYQFFM